MSAFDPPARKRRCTWRRRSIGSEWRPKASDGITRFSTEDAKNWLFDGHNPGLPSAEPKWLTPLTAQSARKAHEETRGDVQDTSISRRRQRKSFSGFHSVKKSLRSIVRRTSISLCLPSRPFNHSITEGISDSKQTDDDLQATSLVNSIWPRRAPRLAYSRRLSMESAINPPSYHTCDQPGPPPPSYLNYNQVSPQAQLIANRPLPIPLSVAGGAAARAAAAANNLRRLYDRVHQKSTNDQTIANPTHGRDSESGIGIEVHYSAADLGPNASYIVRKDPVKYLPTELVSQILVKLDPDSLVRAEHVSRSWNRAAFSHHVWREVFFREYNHCLQPSDTEDFIFRVGGSGVGRVIPKQDWKRMYQLRKQLEKGWNEGHCGMIYFNGHCDSVYCVQFDENKVITGSRDRTIRVWDIRTWRCIKLIGSPPDPYDFPSTPGVDPQNLGAGVSPSISYPTVRPATDEPVNCRPTDRHDASILCLQFDDEILVTGSSDFTCIIWDISADYKPIKRLIHHTSAVLDIGFDKKHIVTSSKDWTICVWNRNTGVILAHLTGHHGPVSSVQLRGNLLASASGDGTARLWNLQLGQCVKEFKSPFRNRGLACVEFSEDAKYIFAGGNDHVIYKFDANSEELLQHLVGHTGLVRSLHLDQVNRRLISSSYDMTVKVFDYDTGDLIVDFPGMAKSWMLAVKADFRRVFCASQDGKVLMIDFGWNLANAALLNTTVKQPKLRRV
ncbi:MAG: hypothetical protein M1812_004546 [Candelaria pacifica]|nr:MAG: hypothetical protein M1812_004546 [Candelaria pacifica]